MVIFEEEVWQKHVWSVTVEEQEAAVDRKQHPRRAQGRSIPGWGFMRSTSSKRPNYLRLSSHLWSAPWKGREGTS